MNEEEESSKSYDNIIRLLEEMQNRPQTNNFHSNTENEFDTKILEYDRLENPFLYKRNFRHGNINQLFVSADTEPQTLLSTDTQLEFLGSLRIWQVAAILIAFFMFMALVIFLFRKLNKAYTRYSPSVLVASSSLENLRGCSVSSSYSSDSTNHLLAKNFSMKPSLNYDKNNFGNLRKQLAEFV
ncbi:hypothetical protein BpHYR1_024370 [Brachionus plicatilis]|uniref:Uncharacterized protein n=1 Tax=Brachionus plicatilis TaxID=10195 RepID=A0A3M7R1K6_BRAPC|nr:hypothetical protein BpHYR1_024370 [Brachionus plicatilis]